jgi:hypothetical protein
VSKRLPTKETLTKETIQKKQRPASPESLRLANGLLKCIIYNNQNFKRDEKTAERWARDIDLMIRLDKRTPKEIEAVIRYSQSDQFWKSNILSGATLRKQFDRLWIKAKSDHDKEQSAIVFI